MQRLSELFNVSFNLVRRLLLMFNIGLLNYNVHNSLSLRSQCNPVALPLLYAVQLKISSLPFFGFLSRVFMGEMRHRANMLKWLLGEMGWSRRNGLRGVVFDLIGLFSQDLEGE